MISNPTSSCETSLEQHPERQRCGPRNHSWWTEQPDDGRQDYGRAEACSARLYVLYEEVFMSFL